MALNACIGDKYQNLMIVSFFFLFQKNLAVNIKSIDYDQTGSNDDMDTVKYNFKGNASAGPVEQTLNGIEPKYNTK